MQIGIDNSLHSKTSSTCSNINKGLNSIIDLPLIARVSWACSHNLLGGCIGPSGSFAMSQ